MKKVSFVVAGFETLITFLNKDLYDYLELITKNLVDYSLITFGCNVSKNTAKNFNYKKYAESVFKVIKHAKRYVDFGGKLMIDSGGYQIITGKIPVSKISDFRQSYVYFLNNFKDYYSYAFSLDSPIVSGKKTEQELEEINRDSYNLIESLEGDVKKKLFFVTHAASYTDFRIWKNLIHKYNLINKYSNYSVGGLVSSRPQTKKLRYNLLNISIMLLLSGLKDIPVPFRFHILGSSASKNIIYFTLLQKHLEYLLNRDVYVTFDSSSVFTKIQRSRTFTYVNTNKEDIVCFPFSGRSKDLDDRNPILPSLTNRELILDELQRTIDYCGLSSAFSINENIYENDTFAKENRIWILLHEIYNNQLLIDYYSKKAKEYYKIYLKDPQKLYYILVEEYLKHQGSYSTSEQYANSIITSFNMLTDFFKANRDISFVEKYIESIKHVLDNRDINDITDILPQL